MVFDHLQHDTSIKAWEDYDLYLRVARQFPIAHHSELIAIYRIHAVNMSNNSLFMLEFALAVLQKQSGN